MTQKEKKTIAQPQNTKVSDSARWWSQHPVCQIGLYANLVLLILRYCLLYPRLRYCLCVCVHLKPQRIFGIHSCLLLQATTAADEVVLELPSANSPQCPHLPFVQGQIALSEPEEAKEERVRGHALYPIFFFNLGGICPRYFWVFFSRRRGRIYFVLRGNFFWFKKCCTKGYLVCLLWYDFFFLTCLFVVVISLGHFCLFFFNFSLFYEWIFSIIYIFRK